jgi:hypothetical protein
MLNENIKGYYKARLFEDLKKMDLMEAPIRYSMPAPAPDIFGMFGRRVKYLKDFPDWLKFWFKQMGLIAGSRPVPGQAIRHFDVRRIVQVNDEGHGIFGAPQMPSGIWYWIFRDANGIPRHMKAPKGWDPANPTVVPPNGWDSVPSSVREELMRRFVVIPGTGGLGVLGQELIDPEMEGEFDPDTVVPDFNPDDYYAGMNDPSPKGPKV